MKISKIIFQHFTLLVILFCDVNCELVLNTFAAPVVFKQEKVNGVSSYVEYHKDHEISEKQSRKSLENMPEAEFVTPGHCKPCKPEHETYCFSPNLLKDHCCCNQGHAKGKFIDLLVQKGYRFCPNVGVEQWK
jgi:hypothetical protein